MRFLLIALTLTASSAFGQTTGTIVLTTQNQETTLRVSKDSCGDANIINWSYTSASTLCSDLRFWLVSGTSCGNEPSGEAVELQRVTQSQLASTRNSSFTFRVNQLPVLKDTCPLAGEEKEYRLCASIKLGGGLLGSDCGSGTFQTADIDITYDAKPPNPPGLESVQGLDKALSIRVDAPEDTSELRVTVERLDGTGSRTVKQSVDQPRFRVEGLENNVTYRVTARAVDAADNESEPSEAQEGTPIFTRGFFDRYVELGGQESGGCGAAGVGLAGGWVLAVLGFWLSSRRNRS
jgi:uncharacterized protein (TIGR03382 family)